MTDSITMLSRQLRRLRRYPELTLIVLAVPLIFLVLFVFVFGETLGAGLVSGGGNRGDYANYVMPAILVMTLGSISSGTTTTVAMDMTSGIIARFRSMSVSPGAFLAGHAFGAVVQSLISLAVVIVVGLLVGFRPQGNGLDWLGAVAVLFGLTMAVSWLSVALGLVARTVESASNYGMPLLILPFLGSGFVPTESMPSALAWFAEYQPFTPIMDTLRALLLGTSPEATTAWSAVAWCVALTLLGHGWARRIYARPRKS